MAIYESGEDYLETILILEQKNGQVRSVDIAAELGYSKPSVSRAMGILKKAQYILMDEKGYITFTSQGRDMAEKIYARHKNLTRYLRDVLGVSEENATKDACRIEHHISEETYNMICKALGDGK